MKLSFGGNLTIRAPERGESWAADLRLIAGEGKRPSAAVYLTASECRHIAQWLNEMANVEAIRVGVKPSAPPLDPSNHSA